jgi:hypothetical protein
MSAFEREVHQLFANSDRLKHLLGLEKDRRKVAHDALVFVGTHNVARHWWCTQQAVFDSRAKELAFFVTYLFDRIAYARRLNLIRKLPRRDKDLLDIGSEITVKHVEHLLQQGGGEDGTDSLDAFARDDTASEDNPMSRGRKYESERAERYPTIRWHFRWNRYSVATVPDGLTDSYAYEYKTTSTRFLLKFTKPLALAQADLYAFFFRRLRKRVQILVIDEDATETYEEPVDVGQAEYTLAAFARVDDGTLARAPAEWKCKRCDFRETCPIVQVAIRN